MAGAIKSLGLGSDGALSFDVIDQLRAADEEAQIKPISDKTEANDTKKTELTTISTMAKTLKSYTSSLSESTLYQKRSVSTTGDGVSVTADAGVSVHSFDLKVNQLASTHVVQSNAFNDTSSKVASSLGADATTNFSFTVDGTQYLIDDIDNTTTLSDLVSKINEKAGTDVTASTLKTGDNEYRLVLKSDETGEASKIAIMEGSGLTTGFGSENAIVSGTFSSTASKVTTNASTSLSFDVGATTITVDDISDTTSLSNLVTMINDAITDNSETTGKARASIIKNASGEYTMVMQGNDSNSTISNFSFNQGVDELKHATENVPDYTNKLQNASDALFTYNGVNMTRASNEISDITVGVTLTLSEVHEEGKKSTVSITQNTDDLIDELQNFVDEYNTLAAQIKESTKYDDTTGATGVFFGDSNIIGIKRDINSLLTYADADNNSLLSFGIELNEGGVLEFNTATFKEKLEEDSSAVETFFRGSYDSSSTNDDIEEEDYGIFAKLNEKLDDYTNSSTGRLYYLETSLESLGDNLVDEYTKAVSRLDSKYDLMAQQFAAYDTMINTLNTQFQSLNMLIQSETNG
jgi:flagellar hook-associated protein 2